MCLHFYNHILYLDYSTAFFPLERNWLSCGFVTLRDPDKERIGDESRGERKAGIRESERGSRSYENEAKRGGMHGAAQSAAFFSLRDASHRPGTRHPAIGQTQACHSQYHRLSFLPLGNHKRQTRKVANAKGLNRNTNLT